MNREELLYDKCDKLEADRAELLECLKKCSDSLEKFECDDCNSACRHFEQGCEIKESKELLKKHEVKK